MTNNSKALTLEDIVFGIDQSLDPSLETVKSPIDRVTHCMVPVVTCLVLISVVIWSLTKSTQYSDLFHTNQRFQYGMWSLNAMVIVLAVIVLCRR